MSDPSGQIDHILSEDRTFPPPAEFTQQAVLRTQQQYESMVAAVAQDRDGFWRSEANEHLHWFEPFDSVCHWEAPHVQWFAGGKTNASYNCLDRQIQAGRGDKPAIIWEGEPVDSDGNAVDTRQLTYAQLKQEVAKCAEALRELGVQSGDVVSIYMPMTPELAIVMLDCARIGAGHSVIFAGFSAESIADRNHDAEAKLVITANGLYRRGKILPLKKTVDEALEKSPTVQKCLVLKRIDDDDTPMTEGRDVWWHETVEPASPVCPAVPLDSETPLFIPYTSGS